jgi:uncharacterized protein
MKLLIVSDVHNAWEQLADAISKGIHAGCSTLLFAGDAHSPRIFAELSTFPGDIHVVSGNNDVPHMLFAAAALLYPRIHHHGEVMEASFDGVRVHMNHYPEIAQVAAQSSNYDLCIHGHTHRARNEYKGTVQVVNPGECCGTRYGAATCVVYTTETREVLFKTLS